MKGLSEFITEHPWMSFFALCAIVSIAEAIYATGCVCECGCC